MSSIELVRTIPENAAFPEWKVDHIDMKGACLSGILPNKTSIVLKVPYMPGSRGLKSQLVCLNKSLHGLREAPKNGTLNQARNSKLLNLFSLQTVIVLYQKGHESSLCSGICGWPF